MFQLVTVHFYVHRTLLCKMSYCCFRSLVKPNMQAFVKDSKPCQKNKLLFLSHRKGICSVT